MTRTALLERPAPLSATPNKTLYRWSSPGGSFHVEQLDATVFRTEATGVATGTAMDGFIVELDRLVAEGRRGMVFFHDWSAMDSYEPSMRVKLTHWRRSAPKGTTESIHVLLRSSLVTLGVSASSIALRFVGIELYTYTDRLAFERRISAVVTGRR
jgi:hypothetical protein